MILAIIGFALLLAWSIVGWVTRRRWNAWRRGREMRVAEVQANEVVRLGGQARATGSARVAAPLSGTRALFYAFEGVGQVSTKGGVTIVRRTGIPFAIDDGSGAALLADPDAVQVSVARPFDVLRWRDPAEIQPVERRLGQPLAHYISLSAREYVLRDGDPVTVVGRAGREGDRVVIAPEDGAILMFPGSAGDVASARRQVRRVLGGLLAVAVALIAAGIAVA